MASFYLATKMVHTITSASTSHIKMDLIWGAYNDITNILSSLAAYLCVFHLLTLNTIINNADL